MQDHHKPPSLPQPTIAPHLAIKVDDGTPLNPDSSHLNSVPLRSVPMPLPPRKARSGCCCRCLCWIISLLLTLAIIIGVTCAILYMVFQPQIPHYSVESLRISDLRLNSDLTLYAKFNVKITAKNPNEKIGIYYEKGGHLSVWYKQTKLCRGSIPKFYQGHNNTTRLHIGLSGSTQYGNGLMSALQRQQQDTGSVPLDLKVDAPVAIKMGKLKLGKVRFLVGCNLVVDSLSTNNLITIRASNCRFNFHL